MRKRIVIAAASIAAVLVTAMIADVQFRYVSQIARNARTEDIQPHDTAIVLGASIKDDGTPSDALRDRLDTGIDLYKKGIARRIFLTGDDGEFRRDEIDVMKSYMLSQGVTGTAITIDGKGFRTYESCKHAKEQGIADAIVVTQRFHQARALYICNRLGVRSIGVNADRHSYKSIVSFWIRDLLASAKAWWDINVIAPDPPVKNAK